MRYSLLPDRGLLAISGDDAIDFLQGLVSNDVRKLSTGHLVYAALLSPQGKFLHDFFLTKSDDKILIDCEKSRLPDLLARLNLYKLRSKVTISTLPDSQGVIAAWGSKESAPAIADPRLPQLGFRLVGDVADIGAKCHGLCWKIATPAEYDHMRLELGVPDGSRDLIVDKTFLLEAHFEELHGVDFNKGCYVGQEVTARSKFRGQVRKSLYKIETSGSTLPEPGTKVTFGEMEAGEIRSHQGNIGLAMLRIEIVATANGVLQAAGQKITAIVPAWAKAIMD